MGQLISINLDPTKDGLVGKVEKLEATCGKYVVIGTNAESRFISEKQFEAYIDELNDSGKLGDLIIKDFRIFYDKSKSFDVDGCNYLVGSFILVRLSADCKSAYVRLGEGDVQWVKEELIDYCSELVINGERYSALCLD